MPKCQGPSSSVRRPSAGVDSTADGEVVASEDCASIVPPEGTGPRLRRVADVAVVETADVRGGQRLDVLGRLDGAWLRRILLEREMPSRAVVVAEVTVQATTEVSSFRTITWSRSSRRMVPITRSTKAFCQGERGAVRTSAMLIPFAQRRKSRP